MNDAFAAAYYSGQANFGSFQGFGNTSGSTYNDDGDEVLVGEDCPGGTQINNGSNNPSSGGGPYGGLPTDEGDPDEDWMCEVFIQETDWWTCVSYGGSTYCHITETTYEITYENCGSNSAMSTSDDDGFCQPTDDNIPIIEPELDAIIWLESICETDAFKNNICVQDVWTKMKENNLAYNSLSAFLGDKPIAELCLDIKDLNDAAKKTQVNGTARLSGTSTKALVTISLNSTQLNRSKLDIARTIIHESIHAELFAMIVEAGGQENFNIYVTNNPGKSDFSLVWDYIQDYLPPNSNWQHEYMADFYIGAISNGIKELSDDLLSDGFKNYFSGSSFYPTSSSEAVTWNWDDFYEAVAWTGLKATSEWEEKDSETQNKYNAYAKYLKDMETTSYKCN
tara:strand:+ start:901 stop:2085 length:1185 start_codon:yes stop_codon:yes gene_type:complete